MRTIDTYQPKKPHSEETMIVHYGVDSQGKAHVRAYEKELCSTCRPSDKRSYSFRILKADWPDNVEFIIEKNLKEVINKK
jgi:hypothetical protein